MIYITGDMHGDIGRFSRRPLSGLKKGDVLIVCGDFGFVWDGGKKERRRLDALGKKRYTIAFVDGTHENFDLLYEYPVTGWAGGAVHKIRENVLHLMRGQIFKIEGKKIFAMGGGESVDRDMRDEHITWWKDEIPTREELISGANNIDAAGGEVDIIVTHEPPAKIKSFLSLGRAVRLTALNTYFEELSAHCRFGKWYFGSTHADKIITSSHISVFRQVYEAASGKKV